MSNKLVVTIVGYVCVSALRWVIAMRKTVVIVGLGLTVLCGWAGNAAAQELSREGVARAVYWAMLPVYVMLTLALLASIWRFWRAISILAQPLAAVVMMIVGFVLKPDRKQPRGRAWEPSPGDNNREPDMRAAPQALLAPKVQPAPQPEGRFVRRAAGRTNRIRSK